MDELVGPMARARATMRAQTQSWYSIRNEDTKPNEPTKVSILLYGSIGGWWGDNDATTFVKRLNAIEADQIDVHIHSPGGDVYDGLAIYQALRTHTAKVTTYVDGYACSAASFIALAGSTRKIAPYAEVMIHDPWGFAIGDASDMKRASEDLERVAANLAQLYADRAGGDKAEWREAMAVETWYSSAEAIKAGLMHEKTAEDDTTAAPAKDDNADSSQSDDGPENAYRSTVFDLSAFRHSGRQAAPAPRIPAAFAAHTRPAAEPEKQSETHEKEGDVMSLDVSALRSRLGLADDADDTAILAAVDALSAPANTDEDVAVEADAEPVEADSDEAAEEAGDDEGEADAAETAVAAALNRTLAAQASTITALKAELGRVSAEQARVKAREAADTKTSVIAAAAEAGKFKATERAAWEARYDKSPEVTTEILNTLAVGSAVPVNAIGVVGSAEPDGGDLDAEFARLFAPEPANNSKGA